MSNNHNGSRIPLHVQFPALQKAQGAQDNPSYESFRPNVIHNSGYKTQPYDTHPNTHMMSIIRRNPDGTLDYQWCKNMCVDAIHGMDFPESLRPIHMALLSVVFPDENFPGKVEPMQADLQTQLSPSEKKKVRELVIAQIKEEKNYNAGRGGGSTDGASSTRNGVG